MRKLTRRRLRSEKLNAEPSESILLGDRPLRQVPLSDAKTQLSALVDEVRLSREPIVIGRHRRPVAVVVDVESFEALLQGVECGPSPGPDGTPQVREFAELIERTDALLRRARRLVEGRDADAPSPAEEQARVFGVGAPQQRRVTA